MTFVSEVLPFTLRDLVFTCVSVWPCLTKAPFGEMPVICVVSKNGVFLLWPKYDQSICGLSQRPECLVCLTSQMLPT